MDHPNDHPKAPPARDRGPPALNVGADAQAHTPTRTPRSVPDVGAKTVLRWSKSGLLPAYQVIRGGIRARSARWPAHSPEQARWVRARIDDGLTFAEILAALERGEFKRPVST